MARAFREGFVYSGDYSPYRKHRHGTSSIDIPAYRLVVFSQNHDQVGNRARSERLSQLVSFESLKLAAGIVMLSPFLPLVFIGEEYGEMAPFSYFISHSDLALIAAVRKGRREEFSAFNWHGEIPDPQDEATFLAARPNHGLRTQGWHRVLYDFYHELIRLRKENPALACLSQDNMEVVGDESQKSLYVRRWQGDSDVVIIYNFNDIEVKIHQSASAGEWHKILDSSEKRWLGDGDTVPGKIESKDEIDLTLEPKSFVLLEKES
jgi:maltooligosyltrehalose trehalohydrolase